MNFPKQARAAFINGRSAVLDAGDHPFALWEVRSTAHTDHRGRRRFTADGGCRVEWEGGHRFVVGAGPGALGSVARASGDSDWDAGGWSEAVRLAQDEQARQANAVARVMAGLGEVDFGRGSMMGWRASLARRSRFWLAKGDDVVGEEVGNGWHAEAVFDLVGRRVVVPLIGALVESDPAAVSRRIASRLEWEARLAEAQVDSSTTEHHGPIVLQPEAASWWVHEMGHAAIEAGPAPATALAEGPVIIDDPALAPWPMGFSYDDRGQAARARRLWPGRGVKAGAVGHARRSSIRDPATCSPACTVLSGRALPGGKRTLGEGDLWVETISSGRFDPLSGAIFLKSDALYRVSRGRIWVSPGPWVLVVDARGGWEGSAVVASEQAASQAQALCTRLGRTNSVMVGAPTVRLECVHLVRPSGLRI